MLERDGAHTAVHGERTAMRYGDVVITPPMAWHGHGNAVQEALSCSARSVTMPEVHARGAAAADQLTRTVDEILAEVQQLPPEAIHWVPGEGVWTVMDNLCHIREFVSFWTGETLRIVRSPSEPWGRDHTDTARVAAVTNTAAYRLGDVAAEIVHAVRRSAETLRTLSDEQLAVEAASRNPRWGVKPASFVVEELLVHHAAKHQGQIRRNAGQFAGGRRA